MTDKLLFELTDEHIKLLQNAYISWEHCEYGAPAIDCKRPYGNSSVEADIIEILEWRDMSDMSDEDWDALYDEEGEWGELMNRARTVHAETETALQIILKCKTFEPGKFRRSETWRRNWERVE